MEDKELWQPVKGLTQYEISSLGRIRRISSGKILKTYFDKHSKYFKVVLSENSKKLTKYVHRLIAEAFVENPENLKFVAHIDGDYNNNSIDNLKWIRYSDIKRARVYRKGFTVSDETKRKMSKAHNIAVTNGIDVFESMGAAAKAMFTSYQSISNCCRGRTKTAAGYTWEIVEQRNEESESSDI